MKLMRSAAASALLTASLLAGCDKPQPASAPQAPAAQIQAADLIFVGGDIVTVSGRQPTAEALAVKDGKIVA